MVFIKKKLKYCSMWKTALKNWVCIYAFLKAETKWVYKEIKFDIEKIYIYAIPPPFPSRIWY